MSATRCQVVLTSRLACGVDRPQRAGQRAARSSALAEQAAVVVRAARAGAAKQEDGWFAIGVATQLPVQRLTLAGVQHAGLGGCW